jgi:hypothetical protein
VLFPWNRNAGASQKALLVDREQLVATALIPLNRIYSDRPQHSALGYLLALHSLKHLATGQPGNRRYKAVENDPSLLHPTLFEIMPQIGIQASEIRASEDHFLRRLRNHTWISDERAVSRRSQVLNRRLIQLARIHRASGSETGHDQARTSLPSA